MKHILGILFFVSCAILASGQSTGNPFDLTFRKSRPASERSVPNPDVKPDTSRVKKLSTPVTPPDTLPGKSPASTIVPGLQDTAARTQRDSAILNPFEVKEDEGETPASIIHPTVPDLKKDGTGDLIPPALKQRSSKGFQIFFVLFCLLFLIFIVNVERSFVRDLWRVISNENYSSLHHRNQRNTMRQILLMMGYSIFIIQAGLFLFYVLQHYGYSGTLLDNIWATMALILGIYLVRHGTLRYLRWLFNNEKEMTLFGFDISIFNIMVGLVLLPLNILMIFGPETLFKPLIIIGLITIGAAYLLRQLRWLLTARQLISNSLFLFFVYLCAVEILPLWAISKLFW